MFESLLLLGVAVGVFSVVVEVGDTALGCSGAIWVCYDHLTMAHGNDNLTELGLERRSRFDSAHCSLALRRHPVRQRIYGSNNVNWSGLATGNELD